MLHTKYQGSRPCGFRQEDFFMFLPIKAYVKPVTSRRAHFWPHGYNLTKLGTGSLDDTTYQLEDLMVLRHSPDLLNNVKIGQDQLRLIMKHILFNGGCGHFGQVT